MQAILLHWGTIIVQLLVAMICGGLIGYQREASERPAGFRTHVLVCVGSAVYMLVSVAVAGERFDQGRIAAQVASGIGFLGAGTIIKQGNIVRGLTTAASLWAVAGIGLAAGYGGGAMMIALLGTLVVFLSLTALKRIELRMERARHSFRINVKVTDPRQRLPWMRGIFTEFAIDIHSITIAEEQTGTGDISIEGYAPTHEDLDAAIGELVQGEGVLAINRQIR